MNTKLVIYTLLFVILLLPAVTYAEPRGQGFNKRQHQQMRRIEQGIMRGDLSPQEARRLIHRERELRRKKEFYASDGRLTPEERRELHEDLRAISKEIYMERHDAEYGLER